MTTKSSPYSFKFAFPLLIVSFFLVYLSTWSSVTLYSKADQRNVEFGMPFHFLFQDQTRWDPSFPWQATTESVYETPTQISWFLLFADVTIVFLILWLITEGIMCLPSFSARKPSIGGRHSRKSKSLKHSSSG